MFLSVNATSLDHILTWCVSDYLAYLSGHHRYYVMHASHVLASILIEHVL